MGSRACTNILYINIYNYSISNPAQVQPTLTSLDYVGCGLKSLLPENFACLQHLQHLSLRESLLEGAPTSDAVGAQLPTSEMFAVGAQLPTSEMFAVGAQVTTSEMRWVCKCQLQRCGGSTIANFTDVCGGCASDNFRDAVNAQVPTSEMFAVGEQVLSRCKLLQG